MLKREAILAIFISVTALLIALGQPALNKPETARTITVTVTGTNTEPADAIYLLFDVRTPNSSPEAVIEQLEASLIDADLLDELQFEQFTHIYNIHMTGNVDGAPSEVSIGTKVHVLLYDLNDLDDIINHIADLEATAYANPHYVVSDTDALIQRATDDGLMRARAEAERIASLSNDRVGEIVSIELSNTHITSNASLLTYENIFSEGSELGFVLVSGTITATVTFTLH